MDKRKEKTLPAALAMLLGIAACDSQRTEEPPDIFYAGRIISFNVGGGPGGGFDTYARTLGPYLTKYLPGHPTIVIENAVAAGSLPLLRDMESRAPQDGTVLGMFVSAAAPLSMLDPETMGISFENFQYIGNLSEDFGVCFSWKGRGITDVHELETKQVTFSDTSAGGANHVYSSVLDYIYGDNVKHIVGYRTTQEARLALERGEVGAHCNGYASLDSLRPNALATETVNIFAKFGDAGLPELADVPNIYDLDLPPETKEAIRFLLSFGEFTRPIVTTPGTPPARVAALREAFGKAVSDPVFLAEAKARNIYIDARDGDWLESRIKEIRSAPPELVALAREISQ